MTSLPPPASYRKQFPVSDTALELVRSSRGGIQEILEGRDNRLLVIVGPCSIHDPRGSGLEYAKRLASLMPSLSDRLLVVMRTFLEKPRTTTGWQGLVFDPKVNGNFDIAAGLAEAREFLLSVLELGVPTSTEFTDQITHQYFSDLICWGAIGARSSEAQAYRRIASGLGMPVGFKNSTAGSIQVAVDGIVSARNPHAFLGVNEKDGRVCEIKTQGNPLCHLVLRGSLNAGPNYTAEKIAEALGLLKKAGLSPRLMVDCSHGNSGKDPQKQPEVFRNVLGQRLAGNTRIIGLMLESHISEGSQKLSDSSQLQYGLSLTDPCLGWEDTEALLREAHGQLQEKGK